MPARHVELAPGFWHERVRVNREVSLPHALRQCAKTGRIANVKTDYASTTGLNEGRVCVKGRFGLDFVHHPERLTRPLIRREGVPRSQTDGAVVDLFREADWDEALDRVAAELNRARETGGPRALGVLSSAKCTNEENYLVNKLARQVLGTNNIDHCARL